MIKLNKTVKNAGWMIAEKFISIFGLFFVTAYVAKYIGPALFGELAFAIALFQIVQVTSQLGGDNIFFKRTAKNPASGRRLITRTCLMRLSLYLLISAPLLIYFYLQSSRIAFIYTSAVCVASLFSALDVYAIYNNATLNSRLNTLSNVAGLAVGLAARYGIAFWELDPALLSLPVILTTAIPFFIRFQNFNHQSRSLGLGAGSGKHVTARYSRYLLLSGGAVVLSGISVTLYPRVNQFFISSALGNEQLGIYAIALSLATSWNFVLAAVITSFYPAIYAESNDNIALHKAARLNRLVLFFSLCVTLIFFAAGKEVILFLYGKAFEGAYLPMLILCFGTLFSSMGTVASRYIIRYSGYRYLSVKAVGVMLVSCLTAYMLTAGYGLTGAAMSFVLVEFLSLTVMNYFFRKGLILSMHIYTLGLGKCIK